ncbi:Uma2 family endonuclease [Elioraea tepidiphila]|uniref:Uma2 family endonuclease n=1 Tax=Elioraea tepidiphila TaxID=457934 RepID=UPI002FDA166F
MSTAVALPPGTLTLDAFYAWVQRQRDGRFELENGQVVAMAPEQVRHARAKAEAWLALRQAIATAGIGCLPLVDGVAVEIDSTTAFVPDVLVDCSERLAPDAIVATQPVIVVEVVSPSTNQRDMTTKLVGYFRVSSIRHYLIVDAAKRVVVHHQRTEGEALATRILATGSLALDPPGITLRVEDLFPPEAEQD